jgi:hypothetical protein
VMTLVGPSENTAPISTVESIRIGTRPSDPVQDDEGGYPGHSSRTENVPTQLQEAASAGGTYEHEEAEVRAFLDRYVEWMCSRDGASLGAMFAPDHRSVLVTVGDSILEGSEIITKHYTRKAASLSETNVEVREVKIFVFAGGQAACVTARLDSDQTFTLGTRRVTYRGARLSMVLEKCGNSWHTVQLHYSLPVGGPVDTLD